MVIQDRPIVPLIADHIQGAIFPASKFELLQYAEGTQAPAMVLFVLKYLPEKEYHSADEVSLRIQGIA